jgi:hypothetical protein
MFDRDGCARATYSATDYWKEETRDVVLACLNMSYIPTHILEGHVWSIYHKRPKQLRHGESKHGSGMSEFFEECRLSVAGCLKSRRGVWICM